jgi:carnitine 3-dehydrogenase
VGGERTSEQSISRASELYESIGMRPLRVRTEIDGFVADRLLEALWREALWLVEDDVATVEEIDDAVRFGPGLRWAQMGTFLTYRIAGGEEGMHHFLEQFGPP